MEGDNLISLLRQWKRQGGKLLRENRKSQKADSKQPRWRDPGDVSGCKPTEFMPGTPEKIAVLQDRARRGEELFHDDDPYRVMPESYVNRYSKPSTGKIFDSSYSAVASARDASVLDDTDDAIRRSLSSDDSIFSEYGEDADVE